MPKLETCIEKELKKMPIAKISKFPKSGIRLSNSTLFIPVFAFMVAKGLLVPAINVTETSNSYAVPGLSPIITTFKVLLNVLVRMVLVPILAVTCNKKKTGDIRVS